MTETRMNASYKRAPQGRGQGVSSMLRSIDEGGGLDDLGSPLDGREADEHLQPRPLTNDGENHD